MRGIVGQSRNAEKRKWKDHRFHGFHGLELRDARPEGGIQKPHAKDAKEQRTKEIRKGKATKGHKEAQRGQRMMDFSITSSRGLGIVFLLR